MSLVPHSSVGRETIPRLASAFFWLLLLCLTPDRVFAKGPRYKHIWVERSANFVVVFANSSLPPEGELFIVRTDAALEYLIRVVPATASSPRREIVRVVDERKKFLTAVCPAQSTPKIPASDGPSSELAGYFGEAIPVPVTPDEPTQLFFPCRVGYTWSQ